MSLLDVHMHFSKLYNIFYNKHKSSNVPQSDQKNLKEPSYIHPDVQITFWSRSIILHLISNNWANL